MELLPGGTKAIFIGDELESGDGIVLGYRDTNGDGFLEEGTREELFRTNDLAHGIHLARNPANGDLMALNRSNNTLLRLNDLNSDLFPDSTEILGEFDPLAEDALYLSFSTDGKTAYANEAFDPRMGGVILPKESWAVAEASVPGGGYIQASTVDPLRIGTIGPAFEAEPLAGQYFIWANGMPATDLEVHRIVGGELQLLGQARTNADGRTIIVLETPLIAGHQLQLRDPMRTLQSAVQTVMAIQLNIVRENGDIWLRWPGRAVHLQSATSLTAPFSMVGQAVSPYRLGNPTGTLFFRLTSLFGLAGLPIQDPCPGGTLLVRQAYSECQDDGFWHVVEDNWYACPGEKEPVRYRVADQKTEQRCTEGMEPPGASAIAPPKVDATCQSPVDTGLKFVLMVCTNGHWAEDTYRIVRCLDGSLRLDGPISNVPAQPPTRCSARPPRPQPPSP